MARSVGNLILSFLSHDWAGLVLASVVALLGLGCIRVARVYGATWPTWLGYAVLGIAGILAVGSTYHVIHMAQVRAKYPPPGAMVDIGGNCLHVFAEARPAISLRSCGLGAVSMFAMTAVLDGSGGAG